MNSMQISKKTAPLLLATVFITPLLVQGIVSASANVPPSTLVQDSKDDGWRTVKTNIITVLFPAGGRKPMFLWWYNNEPENVYVVKFDGLTEHFVVQTPYYKHQFQASNSTFQQLFDQEIEQEVVNEHSRLFQRIPSKFDKKKLWELREVVKDIVHAWGHPDNLPFSGCRWTLQRVGNITANDGKTIGLTFTFNLTRALPRFKFAENNVAIRVRFYYVPVEEKVDDLYTYTVGANEMKMDFVVKDWRWNLDLVQPLLERLKDYGIKVPQTNTSLALGIHLASLNATKLKQVLDNPEDEEVEASATTRRMLIENHAVNLLKNRIDDDETPVEVAKGLKDFFKLQFASDNQTLAGFFKFVASAVIKNSSGTFKVPVKAAYRGEGASLRLFISYPYFNGTLVHDPSIGVETPETTSPPAKTPSYQVAVENTPTTTFSANLVAPQVFSTQLIILLALVATAITLTMLLARSRGRAMVLRSF